MPATGLIPSQRESRPPVVETEVPPLSPLSVPSHQGKPGARGLPGPRGQLGPEVRPSDPASTHPRPPPQPLACSPLGPGDLS